MPFSIQTVYLLPTQCPNILTSDLSSLFRLYEQQYGRRIISSDEILKVSRASPAEAELLHVPIGDPVMVRDRISFDQYNKPFEVLHSVDRGDRYEYKYTIVNDLTAIPSASELYLG